MAQNNDLGLLMGATLQETYTCSNPNCGRITEIHIVKDGCTYETASVVEARKLGCLGATIIQYIIDNP